MALTHTRVAALGLAQTLGWASSYYLPALLAAPMARDTGLREPTVFAAFSLALVVSAAVGPQTGRLIDRHGGRPVLMGSSLLFALALAALALAQGPVALFAAWALLGLAMGSGLYEAVFAALVRLQGQGARGAITGVTLLGGLASTLGWPLTAWLNESFGWREACAVWAALHLLVGLPLNACLPRAPVLESAPESAAVPAAAGGDPARPSATAPRGALALLALVFAIAWFISTALAAHLPALLMASGASLTSAVAMAALVGPAQVAGRLLEFSLLRHLHPLLSARLASLAHPGGALLLLGLGPLAAPVFALLHGVGNGILTIAKGTLPLAMFGPQGYGARQGWLMVPARVAQAAAPWLFGLALAGWGVQALWMSIALGLVGLLALLALRAQETPGA